MPRSYSLKKIEERLVEISQKVYVAEDAIESMMAYSYQYNLKILGIPQTNDDEPAEETVAICLKLFNELKADVKEYDIDIAHRLPNRSPGQKPAGIVCKFTRRVAKQSVLAKRKDAKDVNIQNIVSCDESDSSTILIYDHLTPKKQQLLKQAKSTQRELGYAFCWVKNSEILMRENQNSRVIKIRNEVDLNRLNSNTAAAPNQWMFPSSHELGALDRPGIGIPFSNARGRGRGRYTTRSRANYSNNSS